MRIQKSECLRRKQAIETALRDGFAPHGYKGNSKGSSVVEASKRLKNVSYRSLLDDLSLNRYTPNWSLFKEEPKPEDYIAERKLRDENNKLKSRLSYLERETIAEDDIKEALFELKSHKFTPPKWAINTSKPKSGPGMPILFTSDFQWGEVINKDEMDGVNEFNSEVASQRYQKLIEKSISLSFDHMTNPVYEGIYYLRGGDAVSGDIHQELRETNDLQAIPAVKDLVEHEIWGINELKKKFGKVHVESVPGNHGRTTIKPFSKRYAELNYDTLSAWMIEQWFNAKGDNDVTFNTPMSGDSLFNIYGFNFLLTHGDRIGSRGGEGFIGPVATIARGMKKLHDYYAQLGRHLEYILTGHFHTSLQLDLGFANGCLPGYSEFARDHRMPPKAPSQWLLYCHPDHGISARWEIYLDERPRL